MENEKSNTKIVVKDRKPTIKVLALAAFLVVFIGVLTIERNTILEREAAEISAGDEAQEIGREDAASTIKKDGGNLNFEELNYDISDLLDNEIVQDLPESAVIELKVGEDYYTVSRDSISAGRPSSSDLTISLPADYADQISESLCEMIKRANENRDLEIEMHSSQTALMWKYRRMLKYRECLE